MPFSTRPSPPSTDALPRTFTDSLPLPRVFVFDLDYTLWPFWCDTHVVPPLSGTSPAVRDRHNAPLAFYPHVPSLLSALRAHASGIKIAAASRTHTPDIARDLLTRLHVAGESRSSAIDIFDVLEIYPGDKTRHMQRIAKRLGVAYDDMLFFDDESRNRNVESLGVVFCLVRDGVTRDEIDRGVDRWRKTKGIATGT